MVKLRYNFIVEWLTLLLRTVDILGPCTSIAKNSDILNLFSSVSETYARTISRSQGRIAHSTSVRYSTSHQTS
jgi:hypothetical protein